jgi:hypothetical protein
MKRKEIKRLPPIIEPFASFGRGLSYIWDATVYTFTGIYRCEFCYRKFGLRYEKYEIMLDVGCCYTACEDCHRKHYNI